MMANTKIIGNSILALLMTSLIASAYAQSILDARNQLKNDVYSQSGLCDYYLRQCSDKFARYNESAKTIQERVNNKSLTPIEAGNEIQALAKSMFPKDGLLMSIAQQQAVMARILDYSTLPIKQREELEKAAANTFSYALEERFAMIKAAAELGNERTAARARQQTDRQAVYVDNDYEPSNAIPTAMFLNKVGQAFSSSYNQYLIPMKTCIPWGAGVSCY